MPTVLILASETFGGTSLLEAMQKKIDADRSTHFYLVVPRSRPRYGSVIYTEAVRDAAQLRLDLALAYMREQNLFAEGEIGDGDPLNAAMDAIAAHGEIDELIVSTLPAAASGWLRHDLVEKLEQATNRPVEHVVVDIEKQGLPFDLTLVAANQTVAGPELLSHLKTKVGSRQLRFIIIVPQDSGDGQEVAKARARLRSLLDSLAQAGLVAAGAIGEPDPFDAIMNEISFFPVRDVVISTLPEAESKWLKEDLVQRVASATHKPVDHITSTSPSSTVPISERG